MLKHPTKVKVLEVLSTDVMIRCLHTNEVMNVSANDLVRRVDDGTYELENFMEPPVQYDFYEIDRSMTWPVEQLELPMLNRVRKPVELFELAEMMA